MQQRVFIRRLCTLVVCDHSEVQKYGEVLLKGNAKNVEPLFLETATAATDYDGDGDGDDDAGEALDMNASTSVHPGRFRSVLYLSTRYGTLNAPL